MIDTLLQVIARSIDLINTRQTNNKQYFESIVAPLFVEFETVVKAYLHLFSINGVAPDEAESIRQGYIQSRIKVTELAQHFQSEANDPNLIQFFESISDFFYGSFWVPERIYRSNGAYYVAFLKGELGPSSFTKMPPSPKEMQEEIQQRWAQVVRIYGDLQLKYRTPIGGKI